jgi:type II secretory pathway pseudopilin PulG
MLGSLPSLPPRGTPEQRGVSSALQPLRPTAAQAAFTLVEVMIGTVVTTIMLISLYAGFTFGFNELQLAREEARATQILEEKMELARLLNWDQVVNLPGYVPTNFTESFYASNPTNAASGNIIFTGKITISRAPVTESYSNDLRKIKVMVSWPSGKATRSRAISTFVSQYGMQKYVY